MPVPVHAWRCLRVSLWSLFSKAEGATTGLPPQLDMSQDHSDLGAGSVCALLSSQALNKGGNLCSLNAALGRERCGGSR